MEKLKFTFRMKGSGDGKTNILCLTSIATPDERLFYLPDEIQPVNLHKNLTETQTFERIKNSIKKRNQFRSIWITLTQELKKIYLDDNGNLMFQDIFLEEIAEKRETETSIQSSNETFQKLLEKLLEDKQQKSEIQNLSKIAKDFTIEKFDGKNVNAKQWLEEFEKECERCMIKEERKRIEIFKFFLEKAGLDWYSCMIIKFTVESNWEDWKNDFCETFGNKGWSSIRYAHTFKYQTGSLLEYAVKKEKLLLQVRKSIDTNTLIDLIAIGLPNNITDKIDREQIEETKDLYNEISKLEHLVRYQIKKRNSNFETRSKQIEEKRACKICENAGKGKRFHPEGNCWFKDKEEKKDQPWKINNNSILEVELNNEDPKNL
ncbi:uncharacterized protein LOC143265370 [Megachile rotundata]|uniref:uncharacterized protein LOC143265370 n=1 Tax=Megachile rotundata TaxID=143995 RepID=UPI003FD1F75C